jgi:hypothetical protein
MRKGRNLSLCRKNPQDFEGAKADDLFGWDAKAISPFKNKPALDKSLPKTAAKADDLFGGGIFIFPAHSL